MSRRLLVFVAGDLLLLLAAVGLAHPAYRARQLLVADRVLAWLLPFLHRRFVLLVAVAGLASFTLIYAGEHAPEPIVRADGQGYFLYLPGYLVHGDPSLRAMAADRLHGEPDKQGFGKALYLVPETGNYLEKYPVGEAVLMSPFFIAGHLLVSVLGHSSDGYTPTEQVAAGLSGLFYLCLGLWFLRAILDRHFTRGVSLATLVAITFGTSVFHYGTYDSVFSHAYSFFAVALMTWATPRFYALGARRRDALLLGLAAGLVVLVRNPNATLLVVPLLMGVAGREDLRQRIAFFRVHWRRCALAAVAAGLVLLPQLLAWHIESGRWLVWSYPGEYFNWTRPQFPEVLVAFRPHGLLPWAPVLVFAFAGFIALRRNHPELFPATFLAVSIATYVIGSWYVWFYGGGFGHRAFVDIMPLLALPLGAFYESLRRPWLQGAVFVVSGVMIAVTVLQMVHFWLGYIPIDGLQQDKFFKLLVSGEPQPQP